MRIRVASYNIHMFADSNGRCNRTRIAAFIKSLSVDVLCLQEVPRGSPELGKLAADLGMQHVFGRNPHCSLGQAVLSRFSIPRHSTHLLFQGLKGASRTVLCVDLDVPTATPGKTRPLRVFVTHLDHRREDNRIAQIRTLVKETHKEYVGQKHRTPRRRKPDAARELNGQVVASPTPTGRVPEEAPEPEMPPYLDGPVADLPPHLLIGDFNALTFEDYSDRHLEKIRQVRLANHWEPPVRELMDLIKSYGYVDCGRQNAKPTCWANTRIDYIFASWRFDWAVASYQRHLCKSGSWSDEPSDHYAISVDLETDF